jgi:aquaporin Z
VTLTFLRLGKITGLDALCYITAQFVGGLIGIAGATWLLGGLPAHPSVNYVATLPGIGGMAVAFVAELVISFGLMSVILHATNHPRLAPFAGIFAGILVMVYITVEAPVSGMSMNPARSFGPALLAGTEDTLWIYFAAPLAGMLGAAEVYVRSRGVTRVLCAKLRHGSGPCIFACRFGAPAAPSRLTVVSIEESV